MSTTIPQRELRNHHGRILDRIEAGESFTVTRDGRPVADLVPHVATQKPPRFRPAGDPGARTRLSREQSRRWLEEIRGGEDLLDDEPVDPWKRSANG